MNNAERLNMIRKLILSYSDGKPEQAEAVDEMFKQMWGMPLTHQVREMLNVLTNGLRYGNWPWV